MADEETQLESPAPTDGAEPTEGEEKQPDPKELARELEHERKLRETAEGKSAYWFDVAQKKHAVKDEADEKSKEDEYEDVDLAKITVDNDIKSLDKTLKRLGYVKAGEVDGKINNKAQELTALNKYTEMYPELKDSNSEMFQAVVRHADEIADDPQLAKLSKTKRAELAIQRAEVEMYRAGKLGTKDNGDDGKAAAEAARVAKIKGQSPGNGRKPSQSEAPPLPEDAARVCKAMGISLDDYKKYMPTVNRWK